MLDINAVRDRFSISGWARQIAARAEGQTPLSDIRPYIEQLLDAWEQGAQRERARGRPAKTEQKAEPARKPQPAAPKRPRKPRSDKGKARKPNGVEAAGEVVIHNTFGG